MTINKDKLRHILKRKHFKEFMNFIKGQTVELRDDGSTGIYVDDFMSWIEQYNLKSTKQNYKIYD